MYNTCTLYLYCVRDSVHLILNEDALRQYAALRMTNVWDRSRLLNYCQIKLVLGFPTIGYYNQETQIDDRIISWIQQIKSHARISDAFTSLVIYNRSYSLNTFYTIYELSKSLESLELINFHNTLLESLNGNESLFPNLESFKFVFYDNYLEMLFSNLEKYPTLRKLSITSSVHSNIDSYNNYKSMFLKVITSPCLMYNLYFLELELIKSTLALFHLSELFLPMLRTWRLYSTRVGSIDQYPNLSPYPVLPITKFFRTFPENFRQLESLEFHGPANFFFFIGLAVWTPVTDNLNNISYIFYNSNYDSMRSRIQILNAELIPLLTTNYTLRNVRISRQFFGFDEQTEENEINVKSTEIQSLFHQSNVNVNFEMC